MLEDQNTLDLEQIADLAKKNVKRQAYHILFFLEKIILLCLVFYQKFVLNMKQIIELY